MVKKILAWSSLVVIVGLVIFFAIDGSAKKDDALKTFEVERGSIIDKALAVGRIEPKLEVEVKSKISGIVRKAFVEVGDKVKLGDPLFEIRPDPTPIEFTEAKRQVEISEVAFERNRREMERAKSLLNKGLISEEEYEIKKFSYDELELRLELAREKLALVQTGSTEIANRKIENIIESPITGTVLSRSVEEGDPVVPLTSYQAGTELLTIAKMDNLIFKGNVDEIDVGKLYIGMPVEIEVGAISGDKIKGTLARVSPKAHKEEGSTLFEVEIRLGDVGTSVLRAGYSANADIIITKKEDILLIPERLVTIKDSVASVEVQDSLGVVTTIEIKTDLSDGINLEVTEGLSEGDLLVERPPKEITAD